MTTQTIQKKQRICSWCGGIFEPQDEEIICLDCQNREDAKSQRMQQEANQVRKVVLAK